MHNTAAEMLALQQVSDLERPMTAVEDGLVALSLALLQRDADRIESSAADLHRALAAAVEQFARAARRGAIPATLRRRLMAASGQVAAQRESLARATASLDRAIDVLLPGAHASVYSSAGAADRHTSAGDLRG